jgi:hypothetical protein
MGLKAEIGDIRRFPDKESLYNYPARLFHRSAAVWPPLLTPMRRLKRTVSAELVTIRNLAANLQLVLGVLRRLPVSHGALHASHTTKSVYIFAYLPAPFAPDALSAYLPCPLRR